MGGRARENNVKAGAEVLRLFVTQISGKPRLKGITAVVDSQPDAVAIELPRVYYSETVLSFLAGLGVFVFPWTPSD